ncbi:MAG: EamA family transporter [Pseudomonadota bacterium]|nr:EamA family transporter [Pseudomonadota bacterium]
MVTALLVLSVFTSSLAHIALRIGMSGLPAIEGVMPLMFRAFLAPWIWTGCALHGTALLIWMYALRHVEISYAYPFLALGYVLVAIISFLFLKEDITPIRILGTLVIIMGVILISRS